MTLKTILTTAVAVAALGLGSALRADSIQLLPGGSAGVTGSQSNPGDPRSPLSTLTGGTTVASQLSSFSAGTLTGKLGATVLDGVAENTLGGLTFVYELQNVSSTTFDPWSEGEGITNFILGGWDGFATNFAMGTQFFYASTSNPILPGSADRSDGVNQTIAFFYPYGDHVPPIYSGEISYQLIIFTDALNWVGTDGSIEIKNFAEQSTVYATAGTLTVAAGVGPGVGGSGPTNGVPDGSTTVTLLGLSVLFLGFVQRRVKRA